MGKVSLCPACGSSTLQPFFHLENVPVHQNLLMPSREAAKSCDRGQILLAFCEECGFITNLAFEAERLKYSAQYDNSQVYSATFMAYMERLALELINRHALYNKKIIEIGCGKGEFLKMLCQFGHNRGIGFDPSYVPNDSTSDQVIFIQDFYSERYGNYPGDLICCRHVIEHIQQPGRFVGSLRQTLENQPDTVIFFEMPNVVWILRNLTFWDIFYEHCSYFSPGSLTRLFAKYGFEVLRLTQAFEGQYLWLEARPQSETKPAQPTNPESLQSLTEAVAYFTKRYSGNMTAWRSRLLDNEKSKHGRLVIWGAGAKGVTILNTLAIPLESIEFVVDINPRKQGKYIPGTGQQIVSPDFLKSYTPDMIFVMNPIYLPEIQETIATLGLHTQLVPL